MNAPDYVASDLMWPMGAEVERGNLDRQGLENAQRVACPTCGACQFMGSASTGQVLAEALGLALPGSALTPAPLAKLLRYARATGKAAVGLIESNLTARRILTRDAFENAIILHAATGGSTNALLHLPVIASEAGFDITIDDFDRIHRRVPVLANVKTTGRSRDGTWTNLEVLGRPPPSMTAHLTCSDGHSFHRDSGMPPTNGLVQLPRCGSCVGLCRRSGAPRGGGAPGQRLQSRYASD